MSMHQPRVPTPATHGPMHLRAFRMELTMAVQVTVVFMLRRARTIPTTAATKLQTTEALHFLYAIVCMFTVASLQVAAYLTVAILRLMLQ